MSAIMEQLHLDHRHLARVLAVIEQQLQVIASGNDPDLRLLIDSADYIQHYSDLVHHPKENQVFDHYLKKTTEAEDVIHMLRKDHTQLPHLTLEFHSLLDGALNGALFVSKDELHEKIQGFVEAQKKHMTIEDTQIFPLIENRFKDDDWQALDEIIDTRTDPLFGTEFGADIEFCYENLYQSIKNMTM